MQACAAGINKEIESLADQYAAMKDAAVKVSKKDKVPVHLLHKPHIGVTSELVLCVCVCALTYVYYCNTCACTCICVVHSCVCVRVYEGNTCICMCM